MSSRETVILPLQTEGTPYFYKKESLIELKKELEELYPGENIICDPLSLSVSCHIGPHSLAIAICKKI